MSATTSGRRTRTRGGSQGPVVEFAPSPRTQVVLAAAHLQELLDADDASGRPADALALPVRGGGQVDAAAQDVAEPYGADLAAVIAAERVTGNPGELVRVPVAAPSGRPGRLLLAGIGDGSPRSLRRAGAALARATRGRDRVVTSLGAGSAAAGVRALVEGVLLGGYQPPAGGLKPRADSAPPARVELAGDHSPAAVEAGLRSADATLLARDLAEMPSNIKNPDWLAAQAVRVAGEAGLAVSVLRADRLAAEGFGGLLAVGGGSATPPCLVRIDYRPGGGRARRPVVLVGKGITYDTGGISIKPRESMVPMKTDMSGAAAVLAALAACRGAGVRRPVTGLLPLAENAFGASSYRPGDVVTVRGGRTVEILNTDAEGRMVLADALAHAVATLDPDVMVDIATLTGAATLGLGRRHAAMYATDDRLAAALDAAGEATGELVWRMPLVEEYRGSIDSPVADLRHVPGPGGPGAGSITAALFLREFTGGRRWAHLDIAGPARADRDEHEVTRGATGYGARLLLAWLTGLR